MPGANGKELDLLTRRILDRDDLSQYFTQGLGHGLGTLVHDCGRLSATDDQLLVTGQVWTIEPGVFTSKDLVVSVSRMPSSSPMVDQKC